ncbi:FecCD family ABC transporter permease [Paenibacillus silviterrae]|uniref:FecCD family ABC transporter permease n=1 Tax=Paenibacillus silviterrae TaxID=3242194 RepID=UPI002543B144|nr:iron ABC transporter permease [Paenibacillus chinjuensis]
MSIVTIHKHEHSGLKHFVIWLTISCILGTIGFAASIKLGSSPIRWEDLWYGLIGAQETKEQLIVRTLRLPRALVAVMVGSSLAVAGVIMQAVTRNPLASPQIFGVNSGAALVVVASIVFIPSLTPSQLVISAFLGAALGGWLVYTMASGGGKFTPVKLALAGMTVSMLLSAVTEGLIVLHDQKTQNILFWMAGAVDGSDWNDVLLMLPWWLIGILGALLLSGSWNVLNMGDDVAQGLGLHIRYVRSAAGILVILLAGASVSVAGPIGFVGLVVPHIVRALVGTEHRFVIPLSALLGASLLLYADIGSRFISYPFEAPVGIVTAAVGAPFFLYLVRKGRRSE